MPTMKNAVGVTIHEASADDLDSALALAQLQSDHSR
jgi:hypothetical protein